MALKALLCYTEISMKGLFALFIDKEVDAVAKNADLNKAARAR